MQENLFAVHRLTFVHLNGFVLLTLKLSVKKNTHYNIIGADNVYENNLEN